jgi:hypothetical protein
VSSGTTYHFEFHVLWQTTQTGVGFTLGLVFPAATIVHANVFMPSGAMPGATGMIHGQITASAGTVATATNPAINTVHHAVIDGIIRPTVTGNLSLIYACELSTAAGILIRQESFAENTVIR